jgi:ubiquinone biosynthesis protein
VLSTRADLIPPEWAEEFRKLQDDCPPVPFAGIRETIERELEGGVAGVFSSIEERALATASIAQVHRATLLDGTPVVVKVLRPGVRQVLAADMDVLTTLAEFVEQHFRNLGYSPTAVVRELARELENEIDLVREARATERLERCFADDPRVSFPHVHWQGTSSSVLTLEEIKGILLSRATPDDLTQEERHAIVVAGVDAVFKQCLELGFFHADPHPGNIFALPGGRICFIDCGMTGHLDRRTSEQLADLVQSVLLGDLDRVIDVVSSLTEVDPSVTASRAFRMDAWELVSRFDVGALDRLDIGALLQDFFETLRRHRIVCPSDIVFLIKAITTIESVGRDLDPGFDIVGHVTPHLERLLKRRVGFKALRRRVRVGLMRSLELLELLPTELRSLLGQLRRSDFRVRLEHRGLDRLTDTLEHASRNIAQALVLAALLVGSAILVHAGRGDIGESAVSKLGVAGLIASLGFGLVLLIATIRRRR